MGRLLCMKELYLMGRLCMKARIIFDGEIVMYEG